MKEINKTLSPVAIQTMRNTLDIQHPAEKLVLNKWEMVLGKMGSVPVHETTRDLMVVLFMAETAKSILVDEVALRGTESTFEGLQACESVEKEASEILAAL